MAGGEVRFGRAVGCVVKMRIPQGALLVFDGVLVEKVVRPALDLGQVSTPGNAPYRHLAVVDQILHFGHARRLSQCCTCAQGERLLLELAGQAV
ncbi:hypothetical protein D3C80_1994660 [compost metagenome]